MADKEKSREVKINVDVSEALTGLKAVTREAREAARALRELEEAQRRTTVNAGPFLGHPNTPEIPPNTHIIEIPPHIKKYGKSEVWTDKGGHGIKAWFKDGDGE